MTRARTFLQDESGAAVVDVSVVLAIVVVALGAALIIRGSNILQIFTQFAYALS